MDDNYNTEPGNYLTYNHALLLQKNGRGELLDDLQFFHFIVLLGFVMSKVFPFLSLVWF
jgi:hypothetical protein